MKISVAFFLMLTVQAQSLNGQETNGILAHRTLGKRAGTGQTIKLSVDSIFIAVRDEEPHFVIENVNKSMDAKNLSQFLTAFYESSKVKRQNDIIVRSKTKRLVPGESEVDKFLDELKNKHKIKIVYLPPATGANANAALEEFARKHLN